MKPTVSTTSVSPSQCARESPYKVGFRSLRCSLPSTKNWRYLWMLPSNSISTSFGRRDK